MPAPGTFMGPYRIVALLGRGGMGEVHRARDTRLDRDVAVKFIHPRYADSSDRVRRFEQEARAAAAISHPNVCTIFDVGSHEGAPYVVMELLGGRSLRAELGRGPLPLRRALDYAAQAAHGLAAAHDQGIVHRDLKPDNLFVTDDGRVKVLDFGLAKLSRDDGRDAAGGLPQAMTVTAAIVGTAGYLAPEQARGGATDARSDIFALGAIMHEMASGQRAFRGASLVETAHAILNDEVPPLATLRPDVPPALSVLVQRCLEKDPARRFQSARDLAFALEAVAAGDATMATAAAASPSPRRRRAVVTAALIAAVVLAAGGGFLWRARTAPKHAPVSFTRLTFRRGAVFAARFVPGDRAVVFGASWEGAPAGVYSVIPGTPDSRALAEGGATLLDVSRSGDLALELRPVRFNPGRMHGVLARAPFAGGAPREVLADVTDADWSPDGADLAVVRRLEGEDRLEFPIGRTLHRSVGDVMHPRVSPRGDLVAFEDHPQPAEDSGSVVVIDVTGKKTVLSGPWSVLRGLAWSPRGEEVWFTAEQGPGDRALYAVTLAGRLRLVLRQAGPLTLHDIAPDGRVLLSQDDMRVGLVARDPGTGRERDLSWLDWSLAADLSPDGRTVLFTEMGNGTGGRFAAYLRRTDGTPGVRLGDGWATALTPDGLWALAITRTTPSELVLLPTGAGSPRTLPHGRLESIYWASLFPGGTRVLLAGAEANGPPRLYVEDLAGGEPRALGAQAIGAGHFWNPVSPDGKLVAAMDAGGAFRVWTLAPGSAPPSTSLEPGWYPATWSADSRALCIYNWDGRRLSIARLDVASGRRTPVRVIDVQDPDGTVWVGPALVTPDGTGYAYNCFRVLSDLYVVDGLR